MVQTLIKSTGNKQILQELSQNLFNGSSPSYNWEKGKLRIRIADIEYKDDTSLINNDNSSILYKKKAEADAAGQVLEYLLRNRSYNSYIANWVSKRTNRDNVPRILRSLDVQNTVSDKSLAVVVDVENVPDFKKYFYTNGNGDIKFSSPLLPQLRQAPRLQSASINAHDSISRQEDYSNDNDLSPYRLYGDADTTVLVYAHTKSSQSAWANRRTTDSRKDAADGE